MTKPPSQSRSPLPWTVDLSDRKNLDDLQPQLWGDDVHWFEVCDANGKLVAMVFAPRDAVAITRTSRMFRGMREVLSTVLGLGDDFHRFMELIQASPTKPEKLSQAAIDKYLEETTTFRDAARAYLAEQELT